MTYAGVSDFFYGQKCITGFSRAQLDDALSPLEFAIPDINGKVTQVWAVGVCDVVTGMCCQVSAMRWCAQRGWAATLV